MLLLRKKPYKIRPIGRSKITEIPEIFCEVNGLKLGDAVHQYLDEDRDIILTPEILKETDMIYLAKYVVGTNNGYPVVTLNPIFLRTRNLKNKDELYAYLIEHDWLKITPVKRK